MASEPDNGRGRHRWWDPRPGLARLWRHPDKALAWIAPILLVVLSSLLLNSVRGWLALGWPRQEIDPDRLSWSHGYPSTLVRDMTARLDWGLTVLALLVALAVLVSVCGGVVGDALRKHRPGLATGVWAILFGVALWATLQVGTGYSTASIPSFYPLLDRALPGLRDLAAELNRLALLGAIWLAFSAASLSLSAGRAVEEDNVAHLRIRLRALHLLLYSGAAVLVAGVLEIHAFHRWALALLDPADGELLAPLARSVVLVIGTYWTLLLLSIYAPVRSHLHLETSRLGRLAERPPEQRRAWLEENELASTGWQIFLRLGAVLGPFLAGAPLGTLLELFGS